MTALDTFRTSQHAGRPGNGAGAIGERLLRERIYLLPHRPAPERRVAIVWSASTPRPIPLVWGCWRDAGPGMIRAEYDADELSRACAVWAEAGVRCDAESIVREVFGDRP